jgi:hypothetical protein
MSNLYSVYEDLPADLADDVLEDDVPTGEDEETATEDDE